MSVEWRQGVVVSIPSAGRVRVRFGASTSSEVEMPKMSTYTPAIGHVVQVLQDGPRLLALGVVG